MFGFCSTHNSPFSVRFLFGISKINKHQYDKIHQKTGKTTKKGNKSGEMSNSKKLAKNLENQPK